MKILMFLLPVVIAGVVLGLGMSGTIQIPGISPKKKATATKTEEKPKTPEKKAEPPAAADDTPKDESDPAKGQAAIAKLWNEMDIPALTTLTASWPESELAPILSKMEPDKTVEYLAALVKPNAKGEVDKKLVDRAANLTKLIQGIASQEQG